MPERIEDEKLLRRILWDDEEGYTVIAREHGGKSRWHTHVETTFKRESDGKLFIMFWREAATEYQEHEFPDVAYEAEEYTVSIVKYREIRDPLPTTERGKSAADPV